jgi:hypothetical protein
MVHSVVPSFTSTKLTAQLNANQSVSSSCWVQLWTKWSSQTNDSSIRRTLHFRSSKNSILNRWKNRTIHSGTNLMIARNLQIGRGKGGAFGGSKFEWCNETIWLRTLDPSCHQWAPQTTIARHRHGCSLWYTSSSRLPIAWFFMTREEDCKKIRFNDVR